MDCYDVIIDCNDCRATFASSVFEMFVIASLANETMKPMARVTVGVVEERTITAHCSIGA